MRTFLLFCLSLCACTITEPLPSGAVEFTPPASYEGYWVQVEECSGISGNFSDVSWFYVPGVAAFTAGSIYNVRGYWQPYHHSITLAGLWTKEPDLVRHEMLHALLKVKGHPAEYFSQKCGLIVTPPGEEP